VKDPGPNVLEQIVKSNELLAAILAAAGPPAPGLPGSYNPEPIIYPTIFFDNGDGTFNYHVTADGADFVAVYATEAAFVGLNGIHLKTRTTDPEALDEVRCEYRPGKCLETLANLKVMFRCAEGVVSSYVEIKLGYCDVGTRYYGHLILKFEDHECGYFSKDNGANTFHTMGTTRFLSDDRLWHIVDISINIATHMYRSVRVNEYLLALPTSHLAEENEVRPHSMFIELALTTAEAVAHEAYFDQLLVTPT